MAANALLSPAQHGFVGGIFVGEIIPLALHEVGAHTRAEEEPIRAVAVRVEAKLYRNLVNGQIAVHHLWRNTIDPETRSGGVIIALGSVLPTGVQKSGVHAESLGKQVFRLHPNRVTPPLVAERAARAAHFHTPRSGQREGASVAFFQGRGFQRVQLLLRFGCLHRRPAMGHHFQSSPGSMGFGPFGSGSSFRSARGSGIFGVGHAIPQGTVRLRRSMVPNGDHGWRNRSVVSSRLLLASNRTAG